MGSIRTVVLYGNCLVVRAIGASLREHGDLQVVQIDPAIEDVSRWPGAAEPVIVIFERTDARNDLVLSLLTEHPQVLLISVDATSGQMLVLSGHQTRAVTTDDLVQVIQTWPGPSGPPSSQARLERLSEFFIRHVFISKGEPKMKNLSKRTKTLVGVAAVLVVVLVAGIILLQPGGSGLFGTAVPVITPANPTILVAQQLILSTGDPTCKWSTSSAAVSIITSTAGASIGIQGISSGTATITAKCGSATASTTVTVASRPTATPTATPTGLWIAPGNMSLTYNQQEALGTGDSTCQWSTSSATVVSIISATTGPMIIIQGGSAGTAIITARCASGTATTTITVVGFNPTSTSTATPTPLISLTPTRTPTLAPLAITPANPTIALGSKIDLNTGDNSCQWSVSSAVVSITSGSAGPYVTLGGNSAGTATVTATCSRGPVTTTVTVTNSSGPTVTPQPTATPVPPMPIAPANPSIVVGAITPLITGDMTCHWSTLSGKVSITTNPPVGDGVYVVGVSVGTATVTATCTGGTVSTTVTVTNGPTATPTQRATVTPTRGPLAITPANPTIALASKITLSTGDATCQWSVSSAVLSITFLPPVGATINVVGASVGTATVTANCTGGTVSTTVTVH